MAFLLAIVLFIGGLYMFTLAFAVDGFEAVIFTVGILLVSLSVALPAHVLRSRS